MGGQPTTEPGVSHAEVWCLERSRRPGPRCDRSVGAAAGAATAVMQKAAAAGAAAAAVVQESSASGAAAAVVQRPATAGAAAAVVQESSASGAAATAGAPATTGAPAVMLLEEAATAGAPAVMRVASAVGATTRTPVGKERRGPDRQGQDAQRSHWRTNAEFSPWILLSAM